MGAVFFNKGENCIAAGRLFVEESIHDEFVTRVVRHLQTHTLNTHTNMHTHTHTPSVLAHTCNPSAGQAADTSRGQGLTDQTPLTDQQASSKEETGPQNTDGEHLGENSHAVLWPPPVCAHTHTHSPAYTQIQTHKQTHKSRGTLSTQRA